MNLTQSAPTSHSSGETLFFFWGPREGGAPRQPPSSSRHPLARHGRQQLSSSPACACHLGAEAKASHTPLQLEENYLGGHTPQKALWRFLGTPLTTAPSHRVAKRIFLSQVTWDAGASPSISWPHGKAGRGDKTVPARRSLKAVWPAHSCNTWEINSLWDWLTACKYYSPRAVIPEQLFGDMCSHCHF